MRRYLPLILVAFFLLVILLGMNTYLAGYAGKRSIQNVSSITLYTTFQPRLLVGLAREYERRTNIRINVISLSESDLIARLQIEAVNPQADLVLASRSALQQLVGANRLTAYSSERVDMVPSRFKNSSNLWTGLWYDPLVFAVNRDIGEKLPHIPHKLAELPNNKNVRIGLTDLLAAEDTANLLCTLAAINGEEQALAYFKSIHPQIVQYAKFLSTPIRMAAMGEVDIAITAQSEIIKYIKDGFPVSVLYPEDGAAYVLTGIGLINGSSHQADAKQFMDWLIQYATDILEKDKYYVVPTSPEAHYYNTFSANNYKLLECDKYLDLDQRNKLVDTWVKTVRLNSK